MSVDSNGSWTSPYYYLPRHQRLSPEKVLIVYYCLYGVPVLGSLLLGGVSHYEVSGRRPGTTQGALGSGAWWGELPPQEKPANKCFCQC